MDNNLKNTEPIISVGLVLPADKQKKLIITDSKDEAIYDIGCRNNKLFVNDKKLDSFKLKRKETQHNFLITNVPAGRGFHWKKKIAIRVEGDLKVMIKDRALFLVNYIRLESYLMCVATSEMSGECPDSLLESQIIAARSWLLAAVEKKHKNLGLNVCNDDCCQRYQGIRQLTSSAINASLNTRGKVLTYHNQICDTRYSKSCGGFSENNDNVWNTQPREYLKGIYDYLNKDLYDLHNEKAVTDWIKTPPPSYCNDQQFKNINIKKFLGVVDEKKEYFRWSFSSSQNQITKTINEKSSMSFTAILNLIPLIRGVSGRITKLKILGLSGTKKIEFLIDNEYEIRRVLHPDFLFSSAFIIEPNFTESLPPSNFIFRGAGWGHGVGLCQIGALGMALMGKNTNEILSHYFSSTEIKTIYE